VWLHNLIWGGINSGGMYDLYWWPDNVRNHDLYYRYDPFRDFLDDIPLSSGYYEDSRAMAQSVCGPGDRWTALTSGGTMGAEHRPYLAQRGGWRGSNGTWRHNQCARCAQRHLPDSVVEYLDWCVYPYPEGRLALHRHVPVAAPA
jgi:hypothetical protein